MSKYEKDRSASRLSRHDIKVSRRKFFDLSVRKIAVAGGVLLTGGAGTGCVFDYFTGQAKIEDALREYREKETQLGPVIDLFEHGFAVFSEEAVARIQTNVTDPQAQTGLLVPFQLAKINRDNQDKNFYTVRKRDLEKRRSLSSGQLQMGNPNYFYYDFSPDPLVAATFAPASRTFGISPFYDPNNKLDNLIAAHELDHVGQDNVDRKQLPQAVYDQFVLASQSPGASRRTVGIYEATAYIHELELLNMFTDGEFFRDVSAGSVESNKYIQFLNARPEQKSSIDLLIEIARQYKAGISNLTQIHEPFLQFIKRLYQQQGFEVYHRTPTGFVLMR